MSDMIALPRRLPTQPAVMVLCMKRRASFVIFDTRCEDVANFVMAILQAMSPESQLVVEECGFGPVKPSLAFQRGPPLTMTVLAFCGSAASIKRAVIMTLEKASTTTLDFDKSNPSDKTAWKGITLRTIWSIVRSQNSLFPMAYEEFLSIDQHQRADQVMTALSPDSMRAQTLNFYNLGTSDIRLCLPDFPLAFGPDLLSLEKMRYIAYAFIPSCSEVHQSIFSLIRPAVHISSSSASYQMISLSLMCSDKMLVKLLTWAYKQIYDLPDTVLSDRKKHEMCVSITKQECQSSGDGMNPVVASFMGSIDAINREIDGLETCSDFVNEICAMATDRSESSMLFIDVTERLLRKVGFQVNVSIFASLIAICCSCTLLIPGNERPVNIDLIGPPGTGKSLLFEIMSPLLGRLIFSQQSESPTAVLVGKRLLGILRLGVGDGTFYIYFSNDRPPPSSQHSHLAVLNTTIKYDGVASRKVSTLEKGERVGITDTVVAVTTRVATTNSDTPDAAQKDRTGIVYFGPGGMLLKAPSKSVPFTEHPSWHGLSMMYSTMIMTIAKDLLTSAVRTPTMTRALGWVSHMIKLTMRNKTRFTERIIRVAGSLMAQEECMYAIAARLSGKPVLDNIRLCIAATACPMNPHFLATTICILSPVTPCAIDMFLPLLYRLAGFLYIDHQRKPGMYAVSNISTLQIFERNILAPLQAQLQIKLNDSKGSMPIVDVLMRANIVRQEMCGDEPVILVNIAAVSTVIPDKERENAICKIIRLIGDNAHLFTQVDVVLKQGDVTPCLVLTRDFVAWLSERAGTALAVRQSENFSTCSNEAGFLRAVYAYRGTQVWAELLNCGAIPSPHISQPHVIHTKDAAGEPQAKRQRITPSVLQTHSAAAEFLLPLGVIANTQPNIPPVIFELRDIPRLDTLVLPAPGGKRVSLPVSKSLRGAMPLVEEGGRPMTLIDGHMQDTIFPTETDSKMVMAVTMVTTVAECSYHLLQHIDDELFASTATCNFPIGQPWKLPPLQEDLSADCVTATNMTARAMIMLFCVFQQGLVCIGPMGNIVGKSSLYICVAEMLRSACAVRLCHAWKFISQASTESVPYSIMANLVRVAHQFVDFIDPNCYIMRELVDAWCDTHSRGRSTADVAAAAASFATLQRA